MLSTLFLQSHAFVCRAERHWVILDVNRDKYLCVDRRQFESLGPWLYGWERTTDERECGSRVLADEAGALANRLLNLGILSETFDPLVLPAALVEGLYVHIPFCFHKCHYCDFYSITRQTDERMAGFVDLLLREARAWSAHPPEIRPRTIFFGGGTPSLLPLPDWSARGL